jgi:hypothetical protein
MLEDKPPVLFALIILLNARLAISQLPTWKLSDLKTSFPLMISAFMASVITTQTSTVETTRGRQEGSIQ